MVIKDQTRRSDITVYLKVNLKLLTKLINSAFVGVWTTYISKCNEREEEEAIFKLLNK